MSTKELGKLLHCRFSPFPSAEMCELVLSPTVSHNTKVQYLIIS